MHQIAPGDLSATLAEMGGWFRISLFLIAGAKETLEDPPGPRLNAPPSGDLRDEPKCRAKVPFEQSRRPHIFETHYQQHPSSYRYGFASIDRLVRSGKAPGFEPNIHLRDIAATRKGSDGPSEHERRSGIVRIPPRR